MLATRSQTKTIKYSLCFVDDDENELKRFKTAFEDEFYIGIGTDLGKAEANLKAVLPRHMLNFLRRKVNLYVLDMYFPMGTTNTPEQRVKLAEAWGNCCKANQQLRTILAELQFGVNPSWRGAHRHGNVFYRARSDSRGWRCFFPVRDRTT